MQNFINEIDKLEKECVSEWKNQDMIDSIKDFSRVLRNRVKNCSIPAVAGRSEQLQGFFEFYKQKFGGGFNTDVLEITLKQYQETL